MTSRASWITLILYLFYVVLPWLVGVLSQDAFIRASGFVVLTFGAVSVFLLICRPSSGYSISDKWLRVISFVAFSSGLVVLASIILLLHRIGPGILSLGRGELFVIREEVLNPVMVLCINLCIISSAMMVSRCSIYYLTILLPIALDVLTQGRSFILSVIIALAVFGRVSIRVVVLLLIIMVAVTVIRIDGAGGVFSIFEYLAGESLNTAFGNGLFERGEFVVGFDQAVRSMFSLFPFIGGVFKVESEAVVFNQLIERVYGYYGLAFGVLGFAKFSSWLTMISAVFSAVFVFSLLVKLGLPKVLLFSVGVSLLPVYFRWSPAEYFYFVGRICLIFLVVYYFLLLLSRVKSGGGDIEMVASDV